MSWNNDATVGWQEGKQCRLETGTSHTDRGDSNYAAALMSEMPNMPTSAPTTAPTVEPTSAPTTAARVEAEGFHNLLGDVIKIATEKIRDGFPFDALTLDQETAMAALDSFADAMSSGHASPADVNVKPLTFSDLKGILPVDSSNPIQEWADAELRAMRVKLYTDLIAPAMDLGKSAMLNVKPAVAPVMASLDLILGKLLDVLTMPEINPGLMDAMKALTSFQEIIDGMLAPLKSRITEMLTGKDQTGGGRLSGELQQIMDGPSLEKLHALAIRMEPILNLLTGKDTHKRREPSQSTGGSSRRLAELDPVALPIAVDDTEMLTGKTVTNANEGALYALQIPNPVQVNEYLCWKSNIQSATIAKAFQKAEKLKQVWKIATCGKVAGKDSSTVSIGEKTAAEGLSVCGQAGNNRMTWDDAHQVAVSVIKCNADSTAKGKALKLTMTQLEVKENHDGYRKCWSTTGFSDLTDVGSMGSINAAHGQNPGGFAFGIGLDLTPVLDHFSENVYSSSSSSPFSALRGTCKRVDVENSVKTASLLTTMRRKCYLDAFADIIAEATNQCDTAGCEKEDPHVNGGLCVATASVPNGEDICKYCAAKSELTKSFTRFSTTAVESCYFVMPAAGKLPANFPNDDLTKICHDNCQVTRRFGAIIKEVSKNLRGKDKPTAKAMIEATKHDISSQLTKLEIIRSIGTLGIWEKKLSACNDISASMQTEFEAWKAGWEKHKQETDKSVKEGLKKEAEALRKPWFVSTPCRSSLTVDAVHVQFVLPFSRHPSCAPYFTIGFGTGVSLKAGSLAGGAFPGMESDASTCGPIHDTDPYAVAYCSTCYNTQQTCEGRGPTKLDASWCSKQCKHMTQECVERDVDLDTSWLYSNVEDNNVPKWSSDDATQVHVDATKTHECAEEGTTFETASNSLQRTKCKDCALKITDYLVDTMKCQVSKCSGVGNCYTHSSSTACGGGRNCKWNNAATCPQNCTAVPKVGTVTITKEELCKQCKRGSRNCEGTPPSAKKWLEGKGASKSWCQLECSSTGSSVMTSGSAQAMSVGKDVLESALSIAFHVHHGTSTGTALSWGLDWSNFNPCSSESSGCRGVWTKFRSLLPGISFDTAEDAFKGMLGSDSNGVDTNGNFVEAFNFDLVALVKFVKGAVSRGSSEFPELADKTDQLRQRVKLLADEYESGSWLDISLGWGFDAVFHPAARSDSEFVEKIVRNVCVQEWMKFEGKKSIAARLWEVTACADRFSKEYQSALKENPVDETEDWTKWNEMKNSKKEDEPNKFKAYNFQIMGTQAASIQFMASPTSASKLSEQYKALFTRDVSGLPSTCGVTVPAGKQYGASYTATTTCGSGSSVLPSCDLCWQDTTTTTTTPTCSSFQCPNGFTANGGATQCPAGGNGCDLGTVRVCGVRSQRARCLYEYTA